MATIFIAAAIHGVFAILTAVDRTEVFANTRLTHATFGYPLEMNLVWTVLAVFMVKWATRVKSCACTINVARVYVGLALWSLLQTVTNFNYTLYIVVYLVGIAVIGGISIAFFCGKCRKR